MRILRGTRILGGAAVLSLTLSAQTFTTLYNFGSYTFDGFQPEARAIPGLHGELFGTTVFGGQSGHGTVYELLPPTSQGGAWTELVLHSFDGRDGQNPGAALLLGPGGALYGVTPTSEGGYGTAFELDPPTGGITHWSETVLYTFPGTDASNPSGALVFGIDQSLYGLTHWPNGTVYSLTAPSPGGAWTSTTLYNFPGESGGRYPIGTLAVSSNGALFGATAVGGRINTACEDGCGLIFSLTPPAVAGGTWTEKILYAFAVQNGDGKYPYAGVVLGPNGVLYGATNAGGNRGCSCGTVFSLTPPAVPGGPMTETILHAFNVSEQDGSGPAGNLAPGAAAHLVRVVQPLQPARWFSASIRLFTVSLVCQTARYTA